MVDPFALRSVQTSVQGRRLTIRELTGWEVLQIAPLMKEGVSMGEAYGLMVSYCLLDEEGDQVFPNPADVSNLPGRLVIGWGEKIMELSELSGTEQKDAGGNAFSVQAVG